MPRVGFKKIKLVNKFNTIRSQMEREGQGSIRRYAGTTYKIARRSIRKAPRMTQRVANLGRFGRMNFRKTGKRKGTPYWQKGMYSRPGHPPQWHEGNTNAKADLRFMSYKPIQGSNKWAYTVGPEQLPGSRVPALHERGGVVKLQAMRQSFYYDRFNRKITRPMRNGERKTAHYPERPYMHPALVKAQRYVDRGKGFASSINSLAGLTPIKKYVPSKWQVKKDPRKVAA